MKQFFKFLFASTLGTFLAVFLIVLFFVFAMAGMVASMEEGETDDSVKENTILRVQWKNDIPDRVEENPFQNFDPFSMEASQPMGLNDILKTIDRAKNDDKIAGIFLDMETLPAGSATMQEIRNKLEEFKASGKFVISYANSYNQKAYYLSTVSDKIFLNPEGVILFKGLHMQLAYLKKLLEKIGVEAQVIRGPNNKYKSAVEPLIYDHSSKANREQLTALLDVVWNDMLQVISKSRNIGVDELNRIADNLELETAQKAREYHFVDSVVYRDQVLDYLKKQVGSDDLHLLDFAKYAKLKETKKAKRKKETVAVIYAEGDIIQGKSTEGSIGSSSLSKTIRKVRELDRVKAIVLRVNSPGGDALAAEVIRRELELAAEKMPVIVSMGNLAASGGYWISTPGEFIFADGSTITGSIGVFGVIPNMQELFNDKLGITFDELMTNKNADFIDVMKPMNDFQKAKLNGAIIRIYNEFVERVAESRKLDKAYVDSIARGRVWAGADALKIGLVDSIGGLDAAVQYAAKEAGLGEKYRVSEYPAQKSFMEKLVEEMMGGAQTKWVKSELGEYYMYYDEINKLKEMKGVQARLPFIMRLN